MLRLMLRSKIHRATVTDANLDYDGSLTADENLLDIRLRSARQPADRVTVDRRVAPAENSEPFLAHDALEDPLALQPLRRLDREENHADAVLAARGQREAEARALPHEELVRDLDQHTRAVAGFRIAATGAAMRQVDQNLDALCDDVVRPVPGDVHDESDAARIVFVRGVIQTLGLR